MRAVKRKTVFAFLFLSLSLCLASASPGLAASVRGASASRHIEAQYGPGVSNRHQIADPAVLRESQEPQVPQESQVSQEAQVPQESVKPQEPRDSPRTLLVSVEAWRKEAGIADLCERHHLSVVYDSHLVSMYAVSTERDYTDGEMEALIAALEQERGVLSVQRDQIYRLTDPIVEKPVMR